MNQGKLNCYDKEITKDMFLRACNIFGKKDSIKHFELIFILRVSMKLNENYEKEIDTFPYREKRLPLFLHTWKKEGKILICRKGRYESIKFIDYDFAEQIANITSQ